MHIESVSAKLLGDVLTHKSLILFGKHLAFTGKSLISLRINTPGNTTNEYVMDNARRQEKGQVLRNVKKEGRGHHIWRRKLRCYKRMRLNDFTW
jgi:hypothetical protein